jgi:hypothetical protein
MIAGVIVSAASAFAVAFTAAYLLRRDLRVWIEQPKYRFQHAVQRYDRQVGDGQAGGHACEE